MMWRAMGVGLTALFVALAGAAAADEYGLPTSEPAEQGMSAEKLAAIPQQLGTFVDQGKLPGLITVVARNGRVVHFEAFGKMDVERDKPMRADTIFRMYSMTKPVTGAVVMTLVDAGKVSLDDPVAKYIPEFGEMEVLIEKEDGTTELVPAERPITLKHLMMHTSGLVYGIFDTGKLGELYREANVNTDGSSGLTLEEFAKRAASMPLKCQPGTEWHYSIAMDVLGRVVEVVTGQRFGDYLAETIFEPLGMKDSGFYVPAEKADRFAANYGPDPETGMKLMEDPATSPFLQIPSLDSGGGGMVGTAADYLRFAQMLLNGGELDGVRILSEEAVEEMTSNHIPAEWGESPLNLMEGLNFKGVGFGYCGAVPMDGYENTLFGGEGEYTWGGYASTDFWIDKHENIVGMVLTQLVPTGTYPTRIIMHNAVEGAIVERSAAAAATD